MIITLPDIDTFDEYLDENVSSMYKEQPLAQHWARIVKTIEELGETIQALIGYTGQNPRKGQCSSRQEMLDEMADTVITGILAIEHFTKNEFDTEVILEDRWTYRLEKAGLR